jgi:hypothetical protein
LIDVHSLTPVLLVDLLSGGNSTKDGGAAIG